MRITDRGIFEAARQHSSAARARHQAAVDKAATGIAVSHPGDGKTAADAAHIASERVAHTRAESFRRSSERALDEVTTADRSLGSIIDVLTEAQAQAVAFASDSFSANDRAAAGRSVRTRLGQMIATLNVDVAGRFIFGGTADSAPPFDASGNYVGDTGARNVEIAPGVKQQVTVRADQVIKGSAGGIDVLQAMADFATALETNDKATIRTSIVRLQDGLAQVADAQAEIGATELVLESAAFTATQLRDGAIERKGRLADADMFDAATELALAERTLDAAITASAKSFQLSFLSKL